MFRIPVKGGIPEEVATGGPLDENRCPLHGPYSVLRETEGQKSFSYYALDPVKGKGRLFGPHRMVSECALRLVCRHRMDLARGPGNS